jgi:hypothetical protein
MGHLPGSFHVSTTLAICSKTFLEIYLLILHSQSLVTVLVLKQSLLKRRDFGLHSTEIWKYALKLTKFLWEGALFSENRVGVVKLLSKCSRKQ